MSRTGEVVSRGAYRFAIRYSREKLFLTADGSLEEAKNDTEFCYGLLGYLKLCRIPVSFLEPAEHQGRPGLLVVECQEFLPRVCVWGVSTQQEQKPKTLITPKVTTTGDFSPQELRDEVVSLSIDAFSVLRNFLRFRTSPSFYVLKHVSFKFGFGPRGEGELREPLVLVGALGPEDVSILERTPQGVVANLSKERKVDLLREKI